MLFNVGFVTTGCRTPDITPQEKQSPSFLPMPRYWVHQTEVEAQLEKRNKNGTLEWEWDKGWLMGFRDIARNTDERTGIFSIIPRTAVGHTQPLILSPESTKNIVTLEANLNSFIFDYSTRQKVGGTHLTFNLMKQFPVLTPSSYSAADLEYIGARVLELSYTAWDLQAFALDMGYSGPPFAWNQERRFVLRAELDSLYFRLYGIARDDVDYIMETFPIVKKRDIEKYGYFRSKELILELYDALPSRG